MGPCHLHQRGPTTTPAQVEAAEQARAWTTGMLDFHRVLSNLSEVTSQHAKRGSSSDSEGGSSEEESDASDGEQAAKRTAAPTARPPKPPAGSGKVQQGGEAKAGKKRKRAEAAGKKSGGGSSSSDDSGRGSGDEGSGGPSSGEGLKAGGWRVKAATHIGRFKKRENAKMVQNYSEHDLAAILGGDPFAAAAAQLGELTAQRRCSSSGSSGSDSGSSSGSEAEEPPAAAAERQRRQHTAAVEAAAAALPAKRPKRRPAPVQPPTPEEPGEGQWWFGMFQRAGRLGSMRSSVLGKTAAPGGGGINAHGFSEQDQTNLYNLAQARAAQPARPSRLYVLGVCASQQSKAGCTCWVCACHSRAEPAVRAGCAHVTAEQSLNAQVAVRQAFQRTPIAACCVGGGCWWCVCWVIGWMH